MNKRRTHHRFPLSKGVMAGLLLSSVLATETLMACATLNRPSGITPQPSPSTAATSSGPIGVWLTTADRQYLLAEQPGLPVNADSVDCAWPVICVNDAVSYQQMVGFGASLTDTSSYLIAHSSPAISQEIMQRMFDPHQGIGISFLRQPMGASDFSAQPFWTYDDLPSAACPTMMVDPELVCFSLEKDRTTLALLQQALRLNPQINILSSPWSPPAWMKATNSLTGDNASDGGVLLSGSIEGKPVYLIYANYFIKYIQAYQAQGIPIYALTVQNEPGAALADNPGMNFHPSDQVTFLQNYLVPALHQARLNPKILIYDWNYDHDNPIYSYDAFYNTFQQVNTADLLIAGTSVHCYGALNDLMPLPSPDRVIGDLYETECSPNTLNSTYAARPENPLAPLDLVIDGIRDGSKTIVMWNIAEDQNHGPRPQGKRGCLCTPLVTVETGSDGVPTGKITYNIEYYTLGQVSKFVVPGASYISSPTYDSHHLKDVAFKNPDGSIVLIVHNTDPAAQSFKVLWKGQSFVYTLPGGAAATFTWPAKLPGKSVSLQQPNEGVPQGLPLSRVPDIWSKREGIFFIPVR